MIAISEIVVEVLDLNVSALCVFYFEEGVEHHRRKAVEVEKLHLIEGQVIEAVLQYMGADTWRLVGYLAVDSIFLSNLALWLPCMFKADNVRDEAVREANRTGLNARVSDACLVNTRDAHQHELELTLHEFVRQSAFIMFDGVSPGVGEVSEDIAVHVALC